METADAIGISCEVMAELIFLGGALVRCSPIKSSGTQRVLVFTFFKLKSLETKQRHPNKPLARAQFNEEHSPMCY